MALIRAGEQTGGYTRTWTRRRELRRWEATQTFQNKRANNFPNGKINIRLRRTALEWKKEVIKKLI